MHEILSLECKVRLDFYEGQGADLGILGSNAKYIICVLWYCV